MKKEGKDAQTSESEELSKAFKDMLIFGNGIIKIQDGGTIQHIPIEEWENINKIYEAGFRAARDIIFSKLIPYIESSCGEHTMEEASKLIAELRQEVE